MHGVRQLRTAVAVSVAIAVSSCGAGVRRPVPAASRPVSAGASPAAAGPVRVGVGAGPKDLTYAAGSLWVTNFDDDTVSRVDPVAGQVTATIPVGDGPIGVDAAGGSIWVANYLGGSVSRVDPAAGRVTATVPTGGKPVGLSGAGNVLWVFNQADATATLVDTRTARPVATVPTGVHAGWSTVYEGRIWVPDFQGDTGQLVAIDPVRRRVVLRVRAGAAPVDVTFAAGSGWVANTGDATVTRFDPATGRVRATISVPGGSLGPLLATPDAVWVSVYGGAELARIDPASDTVSATVAVGVHPQRMTVVGSTLWLVEDGGNDIAAVPQRP